jgi:hypothetical protein
MPEDLFASELAPKDVKKKRYFAWRFTFVFF